MTAEGYEIRALEVSDVAVYLEHCRVHEEQAQVPGELPRGPYARQTRPTPDEQRARAVACWSKQLVETGWRRVWGLMCDERVVGHVSLTGPRLDTMLHRSELGVGIEIEHRGRGWGRKLVQHSVDWARQQPALDWLDLSVFDRNLVALSLYRSLGFQECGRLRDSFRVDGLCINDVHMTLWVGARAVPP